MVFDMILYSKIKLHYEKNIKAFKDVTDKWRDVKISFDRYKGEFSAEGDFSRTFFNKQREGNTASSVDGFLYPVAALCHIACYKGLTSKGKQHKFKADLGSIMTGLNRLKQIYGKEKNKSAHTQNVEEAIFTCEVQSKILETLSSDKLSKSDRTSFCHKEFFRAVELNFQSNRIELVDVLNYLNTNEKYNERLGVLVNSDIQETFNSKNEPTLVCINPEFLDRVGELKTLLYADVYSRALKKEGGILPSEYLRAMTEAKRNSSNGTTYPSNAMHYQGQKAADTKNNPDQTKLNHLGKEIMINYGNFLWFKKAGYNKLPDNRIYLNVKSNLNSHKMVLTEMLNIISNPNWGNYIGDFKFTHLGSVRNDTVCIYGDNSESLKLFAKALKESAIITSNLNPGVATLQKQLFPGIGIGMGAEPGDWIVGKDKLAAFKGAHLSPIKDIGAIRFSYGAHRCFLISWAMVRAGRDGIKLSEPAFNDILVFKIAEILADHGIHLNSIHEASIKFESSYFGSLLNNFVKHKVR